ncbi:MAG: hypothetical protein HYR67_11510 [Bacteroidetes bacterium]|nr:hypothetical protein [Bacteroidota bacterium]
MKKIIFFLSLLPGCVFAQKDYSADVKSVDAIVATLYEVISGDPNAQRDWDRFKNLFRPETRLIPTRKSEAGELILKAITPEEYIQLFTSRIATGFFERELHRSTESYGTISHLFSTYETREKKDGLVTNRGINSIQLFYDNHRYFIINIFWCSEGLGFPLPEKYLK